MSSDEDKAAAEASMDVWGEAFMKLVRQRLRLTAYTSNGGVTVSLIDVGPDGKDGAHISMVHIGTTSVPAPEVKLKVGF